MASCFTNNKNNLTDKAFKYSNRELRWKRERLRESN